MNERPDVVKERLGEPDENGLYCDRDFVCNRIDYSRDAIIEASAGTGKTYTLQSIVLKLLVEKRIESVKNLLLVTYTEKAAGELKDRIRKILEQANCLPSDFDEVAICTIHSFCRSLLTEYSFENRVPMEAEICASDKTPIHQAIIEALHSPRYREARSGDFVELMTQAGWSSKKLVEVVEGRFKEARMLTEDAGSSKAKDKLAAAAKGKLVNHLLRLAKEVLEENKSKSSVMTFDDLVERAHKVIVAEAEVESSGGKSALLESIRRKYRIALVDEFQDTDRRQWEIFKAIFSHNVNALEDGPRPKQGALLVVGDPKQAIYSFRGADIGAYLSAKREITGGDDGKVEKLNTTFRSSPKLVDAFNRIFGTKVVSDHSWFEDMKEDAGSIGYMNVDPPPCDTEKFHEIAYTSDFGEPVELLESLPRELPYPKFPRSGYGNKSMCLPVFLRNAAKEMKRLRTLKPAYTTVNPKTGKDEPHGFSYRDMCILVYGHADADKAREILAEEGVPFSVYKEQGIYASAEAEALLALFDFLSAPSRRGRLEALLLTPLFGYRPDQLEARRSQENSEFSRQLDSWQEMISRKNWTMLFESVMNDTLLAHPSRDDADFDRSWAATRQILDKLLEQVGRKAQTIDEFADVLRSWRQDDKLSGEDGALRRKESEADCVQIMTMHVSKGLEFPVVFIAWGFGELAYGVDKEDREAAIRESKRLLYVALTRAEHKLYLPWSRWAQHLRTSVTTDRKTKERKESAQQETGIGSVGSALLIPNDASKHDMGFLARGIRAYFGDDCRAMAAVIEVSERSAMAVSGANDDLKGTGAEEGAAAEKEIALYELDAKELARQRIENDSYSSVHRKSRQTTVPTDDVSRGDENHGEAAVKKKEPTLLPRNNISGDVFHEIMETLCDNDDSDGKALGFCTVGKADFKGLVEEANSPLLSLIGKVMRRHQIASQKSDEGDTTELVLARMAWRALNVPIKIGGRTMRLKDIDASNRRAEAEFVVNRSLMLGDELQPDGDPQRDSAFNGKIDLLIRPDGIGGPVYVLDWKTNSLPDYAMAALKNAMTASGYHLQYQFYSEAVRYWLNGAELGGVAYLFVRAGERSECPDGESGVFVAEAEDVAQETCRTAIKGALRQEDPGYDS